MENDITGLTSCLCVERLWFNRRHRNLKQLLYTICKL